jgi:hypothetical protein
MVTASVPSTTIATCKLSGTARHNGGPRVLGTE